MIKKTAFFASIALAAMTTLTSGVAHGQDSKVEKLPSGVTIKYVNLTNGKKPSATSIVRAHYRGTLDNGKEFDSSYRKGMPIDFPLNQVIPCWTEGVQKLGIGSKAILTCPGNTAYGAGGIPGVIPPNATLTFEVELVDIVRQ